MHFRIPFMCRYLLFVHNHEEHYPNGVQRHFIIQLDRPPVLPNTLVINATCSGNLVRVIDNGLTGALVVDTAIKTSIGTIVYATGLVDITFPVAPDLGTVITATFFTDFS
jgi:hypothetical protein